MTLFSSTASEAISKMVSEVAKKIKGDVDDTNETIINDISLVHKNIEEYNKVLRNFKKTAKSSEKIIDDTIDILNEVNKVAILQQILLQVYLHKLQIQEKS